jgi:CRP/FNR family transcriptional regulator, cyclic AMP receptor protein
VETIDQLLQHAPVFAGLEHSQLEFIAGCARNVTFAADHRLFREGDPADTFYLVRHGSVALETFVPARGSITIETIGPGEVVGWSWLFAPYRWHFDARTLVPVRATWFDGACLRGKCHDDPALGFELMTRFAHVMIERLQWTRLRLLDLYGDGYRN